mgnify:CR=1 FL=1
MTDNLIAISLIGNYLYCPYSIYLHNVYMETDDSVYKAEHLYKGSVIHSSIDEKTSSNRKEILLALPIYSESLGLVGKIDMFNVKTGELVERKTKVDKVYPRHIYQLWAQMFCLQEMGYEVKKVSLYDYSSNKKYSVQLPSEQDAIIFYEFLKTMRSYDPSRDSIEVVEQKCRYCIFTNICDKTTEDNVFS